MARTDAPLTSPERDTLMGWLQYHRDTLAIKIDGLSPDQLTTRSVPPSPLSLIGLVRHMAEVERAWFRRLLDGQSADPLYYSDDNPDGDFDDVDPATVDRDIATWRDECAWADRIVAELDLDDTRHSARRGDISVRWVVIHLIEEYARHNGHADLLREVIDGETGY